MEKKVGLWVCPECDILQGIEVWKEKDELKSRCVNCGVPLDIEEVDFIDKDKAKNVIEEVRAVVPKFFHDYIRYSWVSNKTVGIVFEMSRDEVIDELDVSIPEYFEENLSKKLDTVITVFFEL